MRINCVIYCDDVRIDDSNSDLTGPCNLYSDDSNDANVVLTKCERCGYHQCADPDCMKDWEKYYDDHDSDDHLFLSKCKNCGSEYCFESDCEPYDDVYILKMAQKLNNAFNVDDFTDQLFNVKEYDFITIKKKKKIFIPKKKKRKRILLYTLGTTINSK